MLIPAAGKGRRIINSNFYLMDSPEERNEYVLWQFKRDYSSPDDKEGTQKFQKVVFYKLNPDGSYENGTTLEEMLRVSHERLTDLNNRFRSDHNIEALKHITAAIECLNARTEERTVRGVEGKHIE